MIFNVMGWKLSRCCRLLTLLSLCWFSQQALGHEIPVDARLNIFVRPAGRVLSVLIRAPLGSLGDVDYPTRPGNTVAVSAADNALRNAVTTTLIPALNLFENARLLPEPEIAAIRMALPSDRAFGSWASARASFEKPRLEDSLDLYWSQQMVDVLLDYPIESESAGISIDLQVDRFGQSVATSLRFVPPDGEARAFEIHGNAGLIHLDPSWSQAALSFVVEGVRHILSGIDHLLFLACLVIPFRRLRPLIVIVTAFTVAHSISLIAAALGFAPDGLWFPPLVETLIAVSILYMALENIVGGDVRRRWVLTFAFGLVHGFGFSFGLRETLQFAGDHLLTSLFAFNLGVEMGQVFVLILVAPLLQFVLSRLPSERTGIVILSALIAHTALHWTGERWGELSKFPIPKFDVVFIIGAMRATTALLVIFGLVWLVSGVLNRWLARHE